VATLPEFALRNKERYEKHAREFQRVFGRRLKPYFDMLTGFDVIKFDDKIVKPGKTESTAQAVARQWGDDAVALIRALIGKPEGS